MPVNTLKTSTALEKEQQLFIMLDGITTWQSIHDRIDTVRNIALNNLKSNKLSQNERFHYIEYVLVCDALGDYYRKREQHYASKK
jgi:hypothetical protein